MDYQQGIGQITEIMMWLPTLPGNNAVAIGIIRQYSLQDNR